MTGGYLLLQPWWQGPESVEFILPEGWEVWNGWEDGIITIAGNNNGVFAGDAVAVEKGGGIPLTVVQPRRADPANLAGQQEFADKLDAQVDLADEAWGRPGIEGGRLQACLGGVEPDVIDNRLVLSIPFGRWTRLHLRAGGREGEHPRHRTPAPGGGRVHQGHAPERLAPALRSRHGLVPRGVRPLLQPALRPAGTGGSARMTCTTGSDPTMPSTSTPWPRAAPAWPAPASRP